jgi:glycerol kinase
MGLVADFMNHPIDACEDSDASARGASYLAGLTTGVWRDLEAISSLPQKTSRILPSMDDVERSRRLTLWDHAVERCLFAPEAWRTDDNGLISQ